MLNMITGNNRYLTEIQGWIVHGMPIGGDTRAGGVPEVIADGHDELLVDREDVDGLTNAIAELLTNGPMRDGMGACAKETAKRFDVRQSTIKLFEVYMNNCHF